MINKILSKLGLGDGTLSQPETRRKHVRHEGLQAEVQVNERTFDVRDWSLGGVFFDTQLSPQVAVGEKVHVTLKFRLPHETIIIRQASRIVRAARLGVAAEFLPMSPETRRNFARVIDSLHAKNFLESQVA